MFVLTSTEEISEEDRIPRRKHFERKQGKRYRRSSWEKGRTNLEFGWAVAMELPRLPKSAGLDKRIFQVQ